jgi:hypothetical protein
MALPFDRARLAVGAAVYRAARIGGAQRSGAHVCSIHGPLPIKCGRKCPECGPPWVRHVRWDPMATPPAEPLRPAAVLDPPPRTALDPAQMVLALAALHESDRLAHARALGCRDGPLTTPTPATREADLERLPEPNAPATPPQRLTERQRDAHGRYVAEPAGADRARVPSQAETYARIRRDWYGLPNGAKKPYARELGLPVATVRGIVRGRAGLKPRVLRAEVPGRSPIVEGGLPEAVIRRLARVHAEMDRKERVLVKLAGHWPNGCERFAWRRRAGRRVRKDGGCWTDNLTFRTRAR